MDSRNYYRILRSKYSNLGPAALHITIFERPATEHITFPAALHITKLGPATEHITFLNNQNK